jgi:hypothetical protein
MTVLSGLGQIHEMESPVTSYAMDNDRWDIKKEGNKFQKSVYSVLVNVFKSGIK